MHVDGGYQEFVVVEQKNIYLIPEHLPWEEALMIEPFTVVEQVCSRAGIMPDDVVFTMGAGPVGLSILKMAKLRGAKCIISDVVKNGKLEVKNWITHRFNFTEIKDALHVIENPNVENGKVGLLFD